MIQILHSNNLFYGQNWQKKPNSKHQMTNIFLFRVKFGECGFQFGSCYLKTETAGLISFNSTKI
ncbi:MAG: hypothetical protein EA359_13590 [Balneolaceae bacterium]|nr:MAG: hypothetical protein EA359_13590 [Balneolaceae bacterium]